MPAYMEVELSERQQEILVRVVEEYVATGMPVGSKSLTARSGMRVASSTVRNELAEREHVGRRSHEADRRLRPASRSGTAELGPSVPERAARGRAARDAAAPAAA